MSTPQEVLASSTAAAKAAAASLGGTYTQGAFDASGGLTGGYQPGTPAADPIASSPVRRYTTNATGVGTDSTTAKADAYYNGLATGPVDENAIRAQMRAQAQGQLDAIDMGYNSILAQDAVTANSNAGRTRATQARSGNIGSDFGNGAIQTDQEHSDQVAAADKAAQAAAIANVLAGVDQRSDASIQAEKTLRQTNGEQYIKHLEDTANSARADVINLAKSGVSYDSLNDDQYSKLLDQTGLTPDQLKAQFVLNQPDPIYKGISGSKYIVTTRNPTTGAVKTDSFDLGFSPPQDYNSTTLDTGQIIFTPKDWDGDPKKIITYGTPSAKYLAETRAANASANNANANADKTRKETDQLGQGGDDYIIPKASRNELLKYGFSSQEVDSLQGDIQTYGLSKALNGLDSKTADLIRTQLDPKYVAS